VAAGTAGGIEEDGIESDAALAARLVRAAGALAARMRQAGVGGSGGLRIETKTNITDVVSDADRAAERLIAEVLARHRPGDGLVGEEGARSAGGARVWYADPIDGTFNYVSGLDVWCAALALAIDGAPALGAVYQPSRDELWVGGPGHPTTLNGAPVPPIPDRPLRESSLASYLHPATMVDAATREPLLACLRASSTVRMLGSGSVELASVAGGRIGAWVQHSSEPWDWLPGAALVRGAGGVARVIRSGGRAWHIAGPPSAVRELAETIRRASR
jgi:fructose-1,6-bisphosphatase/inositol monophosphatase family enzyme